jgi:D-glycero-D-manno-heptose 1,7-bisphosphate phosphatase
MVMNGDSWIDADLRAFAAQWPQNDAVAQMLLHTVPDAERFGTVEVAHGRAVSLREKDPAQKCRPGLINSGVYVFDRDILALIPTQGAVSLETDVLVPLVAAGRVAAVQVEPDRYFVDIGVPASYISVQEDLPRTRTRPALFLDRDGTLNQDYGYTHRPEDLVWIPGAKDVIAKANRLGWYVFVVSNQAGVARGLYPAEAVWEFHRTMQRDLFSIGAHIDALAFCPHHPEGTVEPLAVDCTCRKPNPGLFFDLLAHWPIDRQRSFMVGDKLSDKNAAQRAGLRGVLFDGSNLFSAVNPFLI